MADCEPPCALQTYSNSESKTHGHAHADGNGRILLHARSRRAAGHPCSRGETKMCLSFSYPSLVILPSKQVDGEVALTKPEDHQFFGKLLENVDEDQLPPEEAKEVWF